MKFLFRFSPHIFALFLCFYCSNLYWGANRWKGFFLSDSNGYYAYLPALFIYHDLDFSFIDAIQKKEFADHPNFDFRHESKVPNIDKWYCGTAVAIMPFFLIGHLITLATGMEANGYSFWYACALNISAIFYCFVGLLALRKILSHYFENENLIVLILFLILFGTNLFFYSTSEPAMSHVYSFALINFFVILVIKYFESPKRKYLLFLSALLGLILITRPLNGLIVFIIPFLAVSKERMSREVSSLRNNIPTLVLSFIILVAIVSIQLAYYKIKTGSFMIYSYGEEKFYFLNPKLIDFLFSYKKGLFIYLPLILLSLSGFIFLYRKNKWQFYSLLLFLALLVYILSCWWNWWFGGSFGTRPLVEFLFIFSILMGYTLSFLKSFLKKIFILFSFLCVILCQIQTYQYRYYFIHWDRMTKERYWNVFLRIDLITKKDNPNADLLR